MPGGERNSATLGGYRLPLDSPEEERGRSSLVLFDALMAEPQRPSQATSGVLGRIVPG